MGKKIAYLRNYSPGVAYHRLDVPMSHIGRQGHDVTVTDIYKRTDNYDVLIFNRIPWQPYSTLVKLKQKGVRLIMDIDDYWTRPVWHSRRVEQFESEFTLEIIKLLRLADVVWCSTKYLQERIRELGVTTTHYIPNALDYNEPQWKRVDIQRETPTAGWIGATDHHMAFRQLAQPLRHNPPKCGLVLGGASVSNEYWHTLAKIISGGHPSRVKLYRDLPAHQYGVLYNELDIVLLPSHSDVYSLCKSNLKLLEVGAHGLPVITNGQAYKECTNKMGIRVQDARDWARGIKKLTESRRMRAELGQALSEYTRQKYDLEKINKIRLQTI